MLQLSSIFEFVNRELKNSSDRFQIIDEEHIIDTSTGVGYHLYDGWFKITHDEETVAEMQNLTEHEQNLLWGIRHTLIGEEAMAKQKEDYAQVTQHRRKKLSDLYEYPTPMRVNTPVVEPDASVYKG